jgi:Fe-S-cluster-containing dehydrogenase component/CRP-like cAMP-binding protein
MLRGLDARARAEIEAAGTMRRLRAGDVLYQHGDPADSLYVLASGGCTLRGVRRGEAEEAVIRRVARGDVFGEEATVAAFSTRQLEARCDADALIAEVPLVVLKRAVGRAGGVEAMAKVERRLQRAATLDLLQTTSFTRALSEREIELFLDAARHVHVARGQHVYREGDAATDAFLVADGLLQVQSEDAGRPRVEAYLARGDLFGDEELVSHEPRCVSVVASGPTWLVAIPRDVFAPVARRNGDRLDAARRLRSEGTDPTRMRVLGAKNNTTAHVFQDLYRVRVARSLLVIDQDACIRCGHCAWSCADVHDDGVSRLVRRGDKIVLSTDADDKTTTPLLVPNSCQHCKHPSCMIDCPTGAIGRDARGEVFIREDLCTGCGRCAKACPWENIQLAPRRDELAFPAVAVKCDLCRGDGGGPACVAACPTEAVARIDPSTAFAPLAARTVLPDRTKAWPWALGALLGGMGMAALPLGKWASGIILLVLFTLLTAYAVGKRVRGAVRLRRMHGFARYAYITHLSLGALACGVVKNHAAWPAPPNAAGALTMAIALAALTGALGALVAFVIPPVLSRVERSSVLPEELAARPRELDEKIFATLSGKTDLVKTLFVKILRPYHRSMFGPLLLVLTRRTLREEEKAVRRRLDFLMGSKKRDVAGLDDLVRLVVEHRAARAQRLLTWVLRGWLVPHLGATAAAIVLLALHVFAVMR